MSSYYKDTYHSGRVGNPSEKRSGTDRRGLIPRPETPAERMRRLQESGYRVAPAESIVFDDTNEFAKYDLGNKSLPAYAHKSEIIEALSNNRIMVLTGPTGSGKTTQLGQYALEVGFDRIVYLQPRRINADNTGDRIESELKAQLDDAMPDDLVGIAT